jgi:hypothetical protein
LDFGWFFRKPRFFPWVPEDVQPILGLWVPAVGPGCTKKLGCPHHESNGIHLKNTSPAEPKKCGSAVDTQLRHMAPANVLWYITPLIQRKLATMAKRHMGYLEKCHPQVLQCIGLGFPHSNHQNLDVPIAWNKLW